MLSTVLGIWKTAVDKIGKHPSILKIMTAYCHVLVGENNTLLHHRRSWTVLLSLSALDDSVNEEAPVCCSCVLYEREKKKEREGWRAEGRKEGR